MSPRASDTQAFYQYVHGAVRYSYVLVRAVQYQLQAGTSWYSTAAVVVRRGTGSTGTETVLKRVCCLRLQGKHIFVRVHQTHQCIIRPDGKHNKYVVK